MKAGSPVYLDMEAYDITNKACNDAVLTYVRAFDKALRAKTYRAGYYGFSSSSAKADRHRHRQDGPAGQPLVRAVGQEEHHDHGLAVGRHPVHRTTAAATSTWSTARRPAAATRSPWTATPGTPRSRSRG